MRINILLFFLLSLSLFGKPLERVSLQLQWKHQFEFAGFYAAKEKGFYRDSGFNIEFLEYEGKKDITQTVLEGKATFGLTYSSIIAEYLQNRPVKLLANYFKQSPLVLVTQKDIQSLEQLKDKKVMGVSNNIDSITLKMMIEKFGVSLDEIVNVPTAFTIDKFVNKEIEAMAVFTTNEIFQLDKMGIEYNLFDPAAYGTEYYDLNLFTSKEYATLNPEKVQKFIEATNKGWKYALENQEEIVDLILEKYNSQKRSKEALLFEAKQIEQIMLPKIKPIGSIDEKRVEIIAHNIVESNFASNLYLNNLDKLLFKPTDRQTVEYTAKEKAWLNNNQHIRIAHMGIWRTDENMRNLHNDIEYLNLLNKYGNLNLSIVNFDSWKEAYNASLEGDIVQGIFYLSYTKERAEKYFHYLPSYFYIPAYLIVREENSDIKELSDLVGKKVYVLYNTVSADIVKEVDSSIEIIKVDKDIESLNNLGSNNPRGDATLLFDYDLKALKENQLKIAKTIYHKYGEVHIGLTKKHKILHSILTKAHNAIPKKELASLQNLSYHHGDDSSGTIRLSREEQQYLQFKKDITMCIDPDWEPYESISKEGKHIGLVSDFMDLVSKKTGKNFRLIPTKSWQESLDFAKEGRCEIVSFLNSTPEREKFLNFTPELYKESEVIITRDEVTFIRGFEALKGRKVGIVKGYRTDDYIKTHYPEIEVEYIKNYEEGIKMVSEGKLFATINSLMGTAHLIQKSNLTDIKIAGETSLQNAYKIGVIKSDPILNEILTKAVATITEKDRNRILSNRITVKFEQSIDYALVWKVLGVATLLILIFYYRQFTLKRLYSKLKKEMEQKLEEMREKDRILFHQSKLIAMGEMIENIAHQWRQPLASINATVMSIDNLSRKEKFYSSKLEEELNHIEDLTEYMTETIDNFRTFITGEEEDRCFSLLDAVEKSLAITKKSLENNGASIEVFVEKDLRIFGKESDFIQVLLVLANNTKDLFMQNQKDSKKVVIKAKRENNSVAITFSDNGGGIPEEIIDRIFEPYFTTKHKAQGIGLGLYITKIIIEQKMGGTITVSNRDNGACFQIIFEENRCE